MQQATKRHTGRLLILAVTVLVMLGLIGWAAAAAVNEYTLTMTLRGDQEIFIEYGGTYEEPGVDLTLTGTLFSKEGTHPDTPVEITGQVNSSRVGKYELTYEAADHGAAASAVREVWIVDTVPPQIVLNSSDRELTPGVRYEEEGFTASDNYDGDITSRVVRQELEGLITYAVVDSSGNMTCVERVIPDYDGVPPVITLEGEQELRLSLGTAYREPGFHAEDNFAGDLTEQVTVEGAVDPYTLGTYPLTYTVADGYDNLATATREVIVEGLPRPQVVIPQGKTIYLTFDDGPGPDTGRLLDILDRYGVKATFFVVGTGHKALMQRIVEEGHSIAVHSITHDYHTIYASPEAYFADILGEQQAIYDNTGVKTTLMRFPGGSSNTISSFNDGIMTYLTEAVQDAGFQYFDWNVDSNDAGGARTAEEVFKNVTEGCKWHRTNVVLQHDIHSFSVDAVEAIINWGLENGYTFRPLEPDSYGARHGVNN